MIVESDEALSLARKLAERRGTAVDAAVVASLRTVPERVSSHGASPEPASVPEQLTPDQRVRYGTSRAWVREIARHRIAGGTSDHSDRYDKNGLPV